MHDGMPYGRNQGQGQGHSREVDRQSPTGLIFQHCFFMFNIKFSLCVTSWNRIALWAIVFIVKTTMIYSLQHGLCTPFLQYLGQLRLSVQMR